MKKYTFHLTGGSPYNGVIIVIAKRLDQARRLATKELKEYNETTNQNQLQFIFDTPDRVPFNTPGIAYFESGES